MENFEEKMLACKPTLKGWAIHLAKDKWEDLMQDTFLTALRYRNKFDGKSMQGWLNTIMKNIFINNFRSKKRRRNGFVNYDPVMTTEQHHGIDAKVIGKRVSRLSDKYGPSIQMMIDGYKMHEIASATNQPEGTVKSQIFYARKELKKII
jgi:RNA polymerase sigma-70 factor (ECF subfamily)